MGTDAVDFYMTSTEMRGEWAKVRACRVILRFANPWGAPAMVVSIDPPVIGQQYGLGATDIEELAICPKSVGASLEPVVTKGVDVHVYIPRGRRRFDAMPPDPRACEMTAWATLFPDIGRARRVANRPDESRGGRH